jgi:hypothetical protein
MILMSRFRGPRALAIWSLLLAMFPKMLATLLATILLALLCLAACDRPDGPQSQSGDSAAHADQHQAPFQEGEKPTTPPGDSAASQDSGSNSGPGLPFHDSQNLPAGTLLTIRLKNPISAANPGAHATFVGVVDEPVVIAGNKLVPRGATVAGRVESAQASNLRHNRGYLRLALESIQVGGVSLPVQTSSLFVRGTAAEVPAAQTEGPQNAGPQSGGPQNATPQIDTQPGESSAAVVSLEKGRRLTFRLTEPVYVAASQHLRSDH